MALAPKLDDTADLDECQGEDRRHVGYANLQPGNPASRRLDPARRVRSNAVLTFGPHVGELVTDFLEGIQAKRLPGPATRDVLRTILPAAQVEPPPPAIDLPIITSYATYRAATRSINASRREQSITTREANDLLAMARELWRACREQDQAEREAGWQRELVG